MQTINGSVNFRHYDGDTYPCVKVKVYDFPDAHDIAEVFQCSDAQSEKAIEFAYESACRSFWDYWQDKKDGIANGIAVCEGVEPYFPDHDVTVLCMGRSGGWLAVEGLPEAGEWTPELCAQWEKFAKDVRDDVKYRCSKESVIEDVKHNEWTYEGAEMYNFVNTKAGVRTMAQLNTALDSVRKAFYAGELGCTVEFGA